MHNWGNDTYSTLSTENQVGIKVVKLGLETIIFMSNDVVTVLQFSLGAFGRNGLAEVAG